MYAVAIAIVKAELMHKILFNGYVATVILSSNDLICKINNGEVDADAKIHVGAGEKHAGTICNQLR